VEWDHGISRCSCCGGCGQGFAGIPLY
jgi:hypothetical protein